VAVDDPHAKIGLNEVALGLRFPPGILTVLKRRLPATKIQEVLLGAGLYDPAGALAAGIVDELAPADEAEEVARRRLTQLACHPSDAYAACKAGIRGSVRITEAERDAFLEEVVPVWTSPALKERILRVLRR